MTIRIKTYRIFWKNEGDNKSAKYQNMIFQMKNDDQAIRHTRRFARRRGIETLSLVYYTSRENFGPKDVIFKLPIF